jgi:AraC-like DNA-binding protein/mannose-6-phosphate isomerase-like protein (cupin superfamily)
MLLRHGSPNKISQLGKERISMEHQYLLRFEYLKEMPLKSREFTSHDNYEIYYFHQGQGTFFIGDKIHQLLPGTLVLLDGMTLHSPHSIEGTPYVRTTIDFDPSYIRSIISKHFNVNPLEPFEQLGNCIIRLNGEESLAFEEKLKDIYKLYLSQDVTAYDRFKLAFIDSLFFIYNVLVRSADKIDKPSIVNEPFVRKVINYIEENYMNDIQLDQLGRDLYANKYYLARLFREVTGMTIFTYLYRRRINQAKIYFLIHSDQSIMDICFLVGFKNRSHFGKVFKKLEGKTPERFREELIKQHSKHTIL